MNLISKISLVTLLICNFIGAQQPEKFQISIFKIVNDGKSSIEHREIFIDTLGIVKNNQNNTVFKINFDSIEKSIQSFLEDRSIEKFKVNSYERPSLFIGEFPGESINISITKASDLRNEKEIKNKTYYFYYKLFPYKKDVIGVKYDFEKYFDNSESKRLIDFLYQL